VLRPLSKIPFSALLGLIVGLLCVRLLYVYFPLPVTVFGVSSLWIYLAVFLVPALIVFFIFKFFEDLTKLWHGFGFLACVDSFRLLVHSSRGPIAA
jgi:hypothetical protein